MTEAPSQAQAMWFLSADGKTPEGPLTIDQVRARIAGGSVTPAAIVWRDGMPGWVPLRSVPDFAPAAACGSAPAAGQPAMNPGGVQMTIPPGEYAPVMPRKSSMTGVVVALVVVGACVLLIVPLLIGILLPALGKARTSARQIKDSTQIRAVGQGLVIFAQNNSDNYPVPSVLDRGHTTLAAGAPKDLPRHVASVLLYNGFIGPENLVSPAEASGQMRVYQGYQYTAPRGAVNGGMALWDPAFKAVMQEEADYGAGVATPGGCSYAFMTFAGKRRGMWSNSFNSTEAVVGNRGPAYDASGTKWVLHPDGGKSAAGNSEVGTSSVTLQIHGGRSTWEGNIAYNDMHVNYETRPDPETLAYTFTGLPAGQRARFDNIFVNENDATGAKDGTNGITGTGLQNRNNLLRIWTGGRFDDKGALIDIPSNLWFD
jgi:hypothetical protein